MGGGHERQVGKFADLVTQADAAALFNVSPRTIRSTDLPIGITEPIMPLRSSLDEASANFSREEVVCYYLVHFIASDAIFGVTKK